MFTFGKVHWNRVFSHDVKAAILLSQNNETATMLVFQTNPVGVELFSYANAFFCSIVAGHVSENPLHEKTISTRLGIFRVLSIII